MKRKNLNNETITKDKKTKKKKFLKKSESIFKKICLFPICLFKFCISPFLPHSCIFFPSCSTYMILAVEEFGVFKGFGLGLKRLFRCNPWQKKRGYDPVPINIKGENLWIL